MRVNREFAQLYVPLSPYLKTKARSVVQDGVVRPWSSAPSNLHEFV